MGKKKKYGKIGAPNSKKRKEWMKKMRADKKKIEKAIEPAKADEVAKQILEGFAKGKKKVKVGRKTIRIKPLKTKDIKEILKTIIDKADKEETRLILRLFIKRNLIPPRI